MRALISAYDKSGLVPFASGLAELGFELVASGGSATELEDAGLRVTRVEDVTGFPELLEGRVKTLHPRIHAGILARRERSEDVAALAAHGIEPFDLVCVNLYPFELARDRPELDEAGLIEMIDIGGPSLLRGAAKNFSSVTVVCRPQDYDIVLSELREAAGTTLELRRRLAAVAFARTAAYESAIARWFQRGEDFPQTFVPAFERTLDLAYGENPQQHAAYYAERGARTHLLAYVQQIHGKPLSFNNLNDLSAARLLAHELDRPACVIVKHANPCGVAVAVTVVDAYRGALAADPVSAYGGIVLLNRQVTAPLAEALAAQFVEVLFAPAYEDGALEVLTEKPSIRILEDNERRSPLVAEPEIKQVMGGLLIQDRDIEYGDRTEMEVATRRQPTDAEWRDLMFAWRICKHVRSNAIVLAKDHATAGIGAGQMSRVDAVRLAVDKSRVESLQGAVLASDAFFPFSDGPEIAIGAGITAIIQPGGSRRDPEVVETADAAGVAMVFTGKRHFRH